MQAGLSLRRVPGPVLGQPERVTGSDQQDVAGIHGYALLALGRLQVCSVRMLSRLEPAHAPRARDVQEHAATDEPVLQNLDRVGAGPVLVDFVFCLAVVEQTVVGNMAERVDVRVPVVVIVGTDVVLDELDAFWLCVAPAPERRHVVIGGHRVVRGFLRVDGQAHRHRHTVLHQPRGGDDAIRCEQVQGSALVLLSPLAPPLQRAEQVGELLGGDVDVRTAVVHDAPGATATSGGAPGRGASGAGSAGA